MRLKPTYVFATALCALALILGNASHVRAGANHKPPTQIPPATNTYATPAKDYDLPPIAVECSGGDGKETTINPDQSPSTACPKGRPVYLDFGIQPSVAGIPPPINGGSP